MDQTVQTLDAAREAYARRDSPEARRLFLGVREHCETSLDDLYMLADAAWWMGADRGVPRADTAHLPACDRRGPAISGGRTCDADGLHPVPARRQRQGIGMVQRGVRLLEGQPESVEHGLLAYVQAESAIGEGALDEATGSPADGSRAGG